MTIDLKRFEDALCLAVEIATPEEEYPVPQYLLEKLVDPLLAELHMELGDLDYSLFGIEDLDTVFEYLDSCDRINNKLSEINRFFCGAVPMIEDGRTSAVHHVDSDSRVSSTCKTGLLHHTGPALRPFC